MDSDSDLPIGVFDSGIGGLTVMRAIMDRLPSESVIYFGDTARVPYGVKSPQTVARYSGQIVDFLTARRVKMLVVACNTMAAVAIAAIRERSTVPVLDVIEAGAKVAAERTREGRVGVMGTLATINSGAYDKAIRELRPGTQVVASACPLLVPLVEEGWLDHPATRLITREYLDPLLAAGIDTLVLGCTHYPLLRPLLQDLCGPTVQLVDSATTVAESAARTLQSLGQQRGTGRRAVHRFFVTDVPQRFRTVGERFLAHPIEPLEIVPW